MPTNTTHLFGDFIQAGRRFWRFRFKRPQRLNESTFGYMFRFIIGLFSVIGGLLILILIGSLTKWQLHDWMIYAYGIFIAIVVFFGEVVRVALYERILQIDGDHLYVEFSLDQMPVIAGSKSSYSSHFPRSSQMGRSNNVAIKKNEFLWVKRILDIIFGFVFLVLFFPLIMVIATLVKYSSPGPIFLRLARVNMRGEIFYQYRFRTIYIPADVPVSHPSAVMYFTSVGTLLRKSSLDLLPQLINVIRGEMSLVGPRCYTKEEFERFKNIIDEYPEFRRFKPGITGLSMVEGYSSISSNKNYFLSRLDFELHYVRHWSVWSDFKILARTVLSPSPRRPG